VKQKFKLINNVMPPILVAVTVITILIACGDGDVINVGTDPRKSREIDLARDILIKYKIDSLANESITSSVAETPSSGVVAGESSASTDVSSSSTPEVSSSSTDVSSSATAVVSSSSVAPSSSSNPYKPVCEITHKIITSSKDNEFDLFDGTNEYLKNQMPSVKCVKGSESKNIDPEDVTWYDGTAELKWKTDKMTEQVIENLSIKAFAYECEDLTATCGKLTLCYKTPKASFCLSSSSAQASSSSAPPVVVSSSSTPPAVSSSSAPPVVVSSSSTPPVVSSSSAPPVVVSSSSTPPAVSSSSAPPVVVSSSSVAPSSSSVNKCAYQPSWCSNIAFKGPKMFAASGALVSNDTKVNGEALPGNTEAFKTEWGNDICIFITGATNVNGGDAATFTLVNGQAPASISGLTNFNTFLKGIPIADGGYYILRKAEKWWQIENATGGTLPSCTP